MYSIFKPSRFRVRTVLDFENRVSNRVDFEYGPYSILKIECIPRSVTAGRLYLIFKRRIFCILDTSGPRPTARLFGRSAEQINSEHRRRIIVFFPRTNCFTPSFPPATTHRSAASLRTTRSANTTPDGVGRTISLPRMLKACMGGVAGILGLIPSPPWRPGLRRCGPSGLW